MLGFPNLDDQVNVYDKRQGNGFFSVTGTEPIICKYRKGDVLEVLLQDKPLLEGYNRVDVLYISLENVIVIDSIESKINNKVWRIHINFGNGIAIGGGSEVIENLDQKIRDIKLKKLGI